MQESATSVAPTDGIETEQLAYSVPQAAQVLSMAVRAVWTLVKRGKIRSYRVGTPSDMWPQGKSVRISRQALLDFIEQREAAS